MDCLGWLPPQSLGGFVRLAGLATLAGHKVAAACQKGVNRSACPSVPPPPKDKGFHPSGQDASGCGGVPCGGPPGVSVSATGAAPLKDNLPPGPVRRAGPAEPPSRCECPQFVGE